MRWAQYLFSFRGRLNRRPYWLAIPVALAFVLTGAAIVMPYLVIEHPELPEPDQAFGALAIATFATLGVLIVAYLVFAMAVTVKRLHDRNKSAWWLIPFFLIPQLGQMITNDELKPNLTLALSARLGLLLFSLALSLWGFVELGILPGTNGDNRYGADPLAGRR